MLVKIIKFLTLELMTKKVSISRSLCCLKRKRNIGVKDLIGDYIRISSVELIAEEIHRKKIKGSIAELGVYQGNFARHLNKFFPDNKLYLFDTFDGFDAKDTFHDVKNKFSNGKQDFSNTNIDAVLSKMSHPKNCIPVKGHFPESAVNIDDEFVFVSIDADLYKPIYEGLQYFYPKLKKGGYIFIHDFNNDMYNGAKTAVIEFCSENNINYFPLSDAFGTAVILK